MNFLAIDIGSSFIKSALLDLTAMTVCRVHKEPTPRLDNPDDETRELSVTAAADSVRRIIAAYDRIRPLQGVVFSVQMHGALFLDENGKFLSNYITWQDRHTLRVGTDGLNFAERASRQLGMDILSRVGNQIGPGHTAAHMLAWQARAGRTPYRVALLGDAVLEQLCGHPVPIHETEACSTGLYDLYGRSWDLAALKSLNMESVLLPKLSKENLPACMYCLNGREIPLYPAIGDQQAAILGAFLGRNEIMINIGTGAQVIYRNGADITPQCEARLMYGGEVYKTITRLPGGRALNVLIRFMQDIGARLYGLTGRKTDALWARIIELVNDETLSAPRVKMKFTEPAGGCIDGIDENNLYFDRLILGAYKDMASQYEDAYRLLCGSHGLAQTIVLAGGVNQKIPFLGELIGRQLSLPVRYAPFAEDVLAGLARLSAIYSGACADLEESARLIDRLQFLEE